MSRADSQDNFWRGRRVFVTGCTGFLGSWLTAALLDRGAAVTGLIRALEPESQLVRTGLIGRIDRIAGDLLDYDLLKHTLKDRAIDTVFHLAGQTIVGVANRERLPPRSPTSVCRPAGSPASHSPPLMARAASATSSSEASGRP